MKDDSLKSTSAEAIKLAFADVPYPGDDNLAIGQNDEDTDGRDIADILRGKHWRNVSPKELCKCVYLYFTPRALLFYLPAFLLAKLFHSRELGFAGDQVVYGFMKPQNDSAISEIFPLMTDGQKKAIKLFLTILSKDTHDPRHEDAIAALEVFWNQF